MIQGQALPRAFPPTLYAAAYAGGALFSVAIALISYRYLVHAGPVAENVVANPHAPTWLPVHVAAAATALLVGPFQFLKNLRARRPAAHRWLGRLYVLGCTAGGVSGFMLALGSTAGPVATAGFGLLAVAWIATTALALTAALQRRFATHRAWMIRSFALTFAAVTLRLYLPLVFALPVPFLVGYAAISFLCWLPNLAAAEVYLKRA